MNNMVGVIPDKVEDNIRGIYIDTEWNPNHHAPRTGLVKHIPVLRFNLDKSNSDSMIVDVPMELKLGDRVWFHYSYSTDPIFKDEFIMVRYDQIFAYERDGDIRPCAGYIIYTPVLEEKVSELQTSLKYIPDVYRIEMLGCLVKRYREHIIHNYSVDSDYGVDLEVGDIVRMEPACNIPIQTELHQNLLQGHKHVYRGRRCNVLAVLEEA